ncbi:hypothetical protein [Kineococcus rhizosphaerae]|uniref:Uncharacterized protein n=1 Tax=Kineococcus rhizosphaerae TaxID=559628 RepID=A0A2T0QZR0_9ACTN|nr:hypothetical protein [Kineococcus rhizosphaerae]PRY12151.1 hypothetical protein CLV37_111108 [Kineococcus rhizosphaerae]
MDAHAVLLGTHVAAGCTGLLVGAAALAVPKRRGWHVRCGLAYQVVVAVMTSTAAVLAVTAPQVRWGLLVIAVATEAAASAGWVVARRRRPGWLPAHVSLVAGSYVSFTTAALVVNWSSPLAWIVPTLVGSPAIAWAAGRAGRRGRPAPAPSW